jgi:hypothetical protein
MGRLSEYSDVSKTVPARPAGIGVSDEKIDYSGYERELLQAAFTAARALA